MLPAGPRRWIVRESRFDDAAALVASRADELLEERIRHSVHIVVRIHDEEVHRPDVASSPDRRPERENRASDDVAPSFGDEDTGLRKIDQLSKQVSRHERAHGTGRLEKPGAQRDEPFNIRDASRSNQVFHAGRCHLVGLAVAIAADPAGPRGVASGRLDSHARVASDRCCNRSADAYDTASLRRHPARRPNRDPVPSSVTHRHSRTRESFETPDPRGVDRPSNGINGQRTVGLDPLFGRATDAPTEIDPGTARPIIDEEEIG
jgi:hypothetical protein